MEHPEEITGMRLCVRKNGSDRFKVISQQPTPIEDNEKSNIKITTRNIISKLDESKEIFHTPNYRHCIELYDYFLWMGGDKHEHKIKYDDIIKLFLLSNSDEARMSFVIVLSKAITKGRKPHPLLVLETSRENSELSINLEKQTLPKNYHDEL